MNIAYNCQRLKFDNVPSSNHSTFAVGVVPEVESLAIVMSGTYFSRDSKREPALIFWSFLF